MINSPSRFAPRGKKQLLTIYQGVHITYFKTTNRLVVSTSRKKVTMRVYCDGIFENQFTLSTPLKSFPTTCELRELNGDIETIISPQLNFDLIDTPTDSKENIFKFEEPIDSYDLVTLLIYVTDKFASGIAVITM